MERIIVEQLRDRLYYATDTIVTYIDSRVLICNSNEFPQSLEDKAEFITTSKYYILESGDLCPCNDLYYKEDIRLFSRISFERKEEIRKFTFECVYYGLMDELEDEGKKKDLGFLLNRAIDYLDEIGANTLIFPLTPRNLTTVDLSAEWVLFSGGKRFHATNIGRTMVDLARESRAQVSANQQSLLVESYYGLRLAQQIVTVREETYNGLKKHYENALKLEAAGMIDKAGRLFAQVNMDEAKRALEAARKEETVVQSALKVLLNKKDADANIIPTSPLFMNDSLPPKMLFDLSVNSGNYTLNQLQLQQHIAKQEVRIAQSGYLPNIALFGKQTLYSHGIQSNLLPRTMVGIGFTWNLFDGLDREKRVRQSKLTEQTLALGQMKARDDLAVGVDKLYTQLEKAQDNVKALNATIALSEELVRIRKKSFTEGMATSTEVIDAETMLASVKVARLAAYYEYDVALMNLLSLCGTPEQFANYQPKP